MCPQCGRSYSHERTLRVHLRDQCGQEPKYACYQCPYRSRQRSNLYSHIRTKHDYEYQSPTLFSHSTTFRSLWMSSDDENSTHVNDYIY